ncbi:MBL fold metallo-hydrolase [Persicimonas caeni]|uniref:MBL fold metallo-hydrolase n=1 Tax=Persicimonas caeni TaxID=2292766 RepID=A0A4Y6PZR1_PERCE|nr:MBL fold metallo-hydrolase [Persicimonas caeni]QDG53811.1 MBL fold metallo-hydrolase [Persicimonas caeni]QED35032.1 MBL fold metallo-hydrolase [Persicimonas caeni]
MDDTIKIRILASGSKGNSAFVRVGDTRLLIDAGISCRRIVHGLRDIDESPEDLDAVLLTHEHSDHVKGMRVFLNNYPETHVFSTRGTLVGCEERFPMPQNWTPIAADGPFRVGEVTVDPFELLHDASEPTGFRLDASGFSMGFVTDLGYWTDEIAEHLLGCRVLVVEANHDPHMLRTGPYPAFLKRRIASSRGHLSNEQARALVSRIAHPELEWLVLAHLSEKNNAPELAIDEISPALPTGDTNIIAASKEPGQPIELAPSELPPSTRPVKQGVLF